MQGSEWRLGGPGRFARAVAGDLEEGRSATVVLPAKGVPEGFQAAVRNLLPDLPANHLEVEALTDSRRRVVDCLYEVLGLARPAGEQRLHVDSFSDHDQLGRRLIWVDCRGATQQQGEAWGTFLKHYAAAVTSVPQPDRTVFSTLCDGAHATAMPDSDRLVSKRWWWRALSPLDTAVYVSELLQDDDQLPGFAEAVTEVAGFDLGVASMLVDSWNGAIDRLEPLLAGYDEELGACEVPWSPEPSPSSHPSADLVPAWSQGVVNAWGEHDPHRHPCFTCASDPQALRHLIWRGQVRSLMPRIEIERQLLAEWVYDRRDRLPPKWAEQDIMGLEVGGLSALFNEVPELVRRDRHMAERAHWLRMARNRIAHVRILDRRELARARKIFNRD